MCGWGWGYCGWENGDGWVRFLGLEMEGLFGWVSTMSIGPYFVLSRCGDPLLLFWYSYIDDEVFFAVPII